MLFQHVYRYELLSTNHKIYMKSKIKFSQMRRFFYCCFIWQKISSLKGVCHEISTSIFSWFEPIQAPNKQAEMFSNSVSTSPR